MAVVVLDYVDLGTSPFALGSENYKSLPKSSRKPSRGNRMQFLVLRVGNSSSFRVCVHTEVLNASIRFFWRWKVITFIGMHMIQMIITVDCEEPQAKIRAAPPVALHAGHHFVAKHQMDTEKTTLRLRTQHPDRDILNHLRWSPNGPKPCKPEPQ